MNRPKSYNLFEQGLPNLPNPPCSSFKSSKTSTIPSSGQISLPLAFVRLRKTTKKGYIERARERNGYLHTSFHLHCLPLILLVPTCLILLVPSFSFLLLLVPAYTQLIIYKRVSSGLLVTDHGGSFGGSRKRIGQMYLCRFVGLTSCNSRLKTAVVGARTLPSQLHPGHDPPPSFSLFPTS